MSIVKAILIWLPFVALMLTAIHLVHHLSPIHMAIAADSPMVGKKAPALNLPALDEKDTPLTTADITGKPKLLNFFASWCGPCKMENDELMALRKQGIPIEGVALQDSPPALWSYLGARGNAYEKIGMDNSGSTSIDWGVRGIPETFVIDGKGTIVAHHLGPMDASDAAELVGKLKAAE
jgi:cytochrome c biogenesis protein CcmG/thiol:disulfide interchange protein DsbE